MFSWMECKAIPIQAWTGPGGSMSLRLPKFIENRHINVAWLLGLHTGRFYVPGNTVVTHFCYRLSRPQGRSAAGTIK
jgi:hypothetical protein